MREYLQCGRRSWVGLLAGVLLGMGCASTKVDWNSRIGQVTYDEVVVDMGPPDKQAQLRDGTVVADWLTRRATQTVTVVGGYYPGPIYAPADMVYVDRYTPDYYLRLIFDPNGKLQSWKKLRR